MMGGARDEYLIWSHEHAAWWGPGGCGYVRSLAAAGRYSHAAALDICAKAMPGTARAFGALPELPVRLDDVQQLRDGYRALFPATPPEVWE
jgi:hypothetical protein